VVERVAHRVAVMYLGQIVEIGPRQAVLGNPQHAYTRRLLAAVPVADPRRRVRTGTSTIARCLRPCGVWATRPWLRNWSRSGRIITPPATASADFIKPGRRSSDV